LGAHCIATSIGFFYAENMETTNELLEEISCERKDKRSKYLENLIELIFESGGYDTDIAKIEKEYHCCISVSKEKHNSLQYTLYYTITSDLIDAELSLEIEDGINNGTQLNSYSFEGSIEPQSRTVEIIKDIVLDESQYEDNSFFKRKSQAILDRDKHFIFEYIRKNNYDNYVTGGNSKMKSNELWTELHLSYIYEEVEVDLHIV